MAREGAVISIEVDAEDLKLALKKAPDILRREISKAGRDAAKTILAVEGLRNYPAQQSPSNPRSGYKRGVGSYYRRADGTVKQYHNSEDVGSKWTVRTTSDFKTVIGNSASYAPFLHGTKGRTGPVGQARRMAKRGWRQILDVAQEMVFKYKHHYERAVERALQKAGLK